MKLGPKYKICRRVGDRVFGKCESPNFEMNPAGAQGKRGRRRSRSEYGLQLLEKQKVRLTYGTSEKQFANYVKKAVSKAGTNPAERLYEQLERRLDNTVYRLGITSSRRHARQMVSHGHIRVNGRRVNIPSYTVSEGDVIEVKDRSKESPMFSELGEKLQTYQHPKWITFDAKKFQATIQGVPKLETSEATFNLKSVIEFYSR